MPTDILTPGVYIEELPASASPIQGVPTAVALFIGTAANAPSAAPVALAGPGDIARALGPVPPDHLLASALNAYFANGGRRAWVACITGDPAMTPTSPGFLASLDAMLAPDGPIASVECFNLLVVPGLIDVPTAIRLQTLCAERMAFLVLDAPEGAEPAAAIDHARALAAGPDAKNSALYYPGVMVVDAGTPGAPRRMPPSGAVAGVYARMDDATGVWTAPAGIDASLRGIVGVERAVNDLEQGPLNLEGVNVLRQFPVYGPVVWGARTLAPNAPDWRYVPVRRLALFVQASVETGLQWAVFEPNGPPLWATVRLSVATFLDGLWRQGAFMGSTPREAYGVECGGGTTMTAQDVAEGRLVLSLRFAPLRPAEFIVIGIEVDTAGP